MEDDLSDIEKRYFTLQKNNAVLYVTYSPLFAPLQKEIENFYSTKISIASAKVCDNCSTAVQK